MTTHERARLAALHEYRLLDAPAGDELEAVVRVAAGVCGVPTATLNLIDENRQCQLTTTGFDGGDSPRADSMCAVGFEKGEVVYRPDARLDPVYAGNPWVTGVYADVRFYLSAPLVTPQGHALGSLCVFDGQPRELTAEQIDRVRDLAQVILGLFERRRQARHNAELAGDLKRANAELRRSNAELEQFAGVVSHDLAAPLSVVGGYLELLGEELDGDTQATGWIGAARRTVDRMSGLIRQLLQNLIGNALKYRHPGRACRITIGARREGAEWVVSVADNGIGIPAAQRDRVFEMFAQVDRAAGHGFGVGLSTCQRIVDRHGGRIAATETPGGGTTVTFTVPAVAGVPAARR